MGQAEHGRAAIRGELKRLEELGEALGQPARLPEQEVAAQVVGQLVLHGGRGGAGQPREALVPRVRCAREDDEGLIAVAGEDAADPLGEDALELEGVREDVDGEPGHLPFEGGGPGGGEHGGAGALQVRDGLAGLAGRQVGLEHEVFALQLQPGLAALTGAAGGDLRTDDDARGGRGEEQREQQAFDTSMHVEPPPVKPVGRRAMHDGRIVPATGGEHTVAGRGALYIRRGPSWLTLPPLFPLLAPRPLAPWPFCSGRAWRS